MLHILLILLSLANADGVDIVPFAVTYHLFTPTSASQSFSDKLSSDGLLIYTPVLALSYVEESTTTYETTKGFVGYNSVGGVMAGGMWSDGVKKGGLYEGFLYGVYAQDASRFYQYNIMPAGVPIGSWLAVCPIVGGEVAYKLGPVKLNLALTPFLELLYLSWSF